MNRSHQFAVVNGEWTRIYMGQPVNRNRENMRRYRQRVRLPLHEVERLEMLDAVHLARANAHLAKLGFGS